MKCLITRPHFEDALEETECGHSQDVSHYENDDPMEKNTPLSDLDILANSAGNFLKQNSGSVTMIISSESAEPDGQ